MGAAKRRLIGYYQGVNKGKPIPPVPGSGDKLTNADGQKLRWLLEAPLFIDSRGVSRLYDSIVRPAANEGDRTIEIERGGELELELAASAKGTLGLGGGLWDALGVPRIEGEGGLETKTTGTGSIKKTQSVVLKPIETSERKLAQIAIVYHAQHRSRFALVEDASSPEWYHRNSIGPSPRKLVFLDLPGHTALTLIPTVAEFKEGKFEWIYQNLIQKITANAVAGTNLTEPKDPDKETDPQKKQALERDYWQFFANHFASGRHAMVAVEEASTKHGRIQWIDYRLPLDTAGNTLHLHLCPNGEYDTGVFAYQLIRRSFKNGVRLVGTLKAGPALDILAVFEK